MILKNKGMFLETLINQTCQNFEQDLRIFIQKIPLNSQLISIENNVLKSKLKINNFCDYIGFYKGIYLEFEAKETENDYFNLSNLKQHQLNKLSFVENSGGISFVLIYFHQFESLFLITIKQLNELKIKKIPYSYFKQNCLQVEIQGIYIDFLKIFSHLTNYI